jgi:hypothetical protein
MFKLYFLTCKFEFIVAMEKVGYRSEILIRFLFLDGKTYLEIKEKLEALYGDLSPSITTIRYWFNEFKHGRTSVLDEERPGRSIEVTTDEMVYNSRDIVEIVGISFEWVQNILHEYLGMTKLSARWVPRWLTVDNKRNRMATSKHCFDLYHCNRKEFLRRFITVDETWIYHYTPEMNEQSKQWISPGKQAPKKVKTVPSAGKVMTTVFWNSKGIIFIDYLERGRTITGQH